MPAMSSLERWFCRSALWRAGEAASAVELPIPEAGAKVLEVGAGGGTVAQRLLTQDRALRYTVVDIDPIMVDAATHRLPHFPNAIVQIGDVCALPFADNSFDSVISCLMLHHVVAWEQALAEIDRVLRPGGRFVGYDLVRTPLTSVVHRVDRSPHRLLSPAELISACRRLDMDVQTRTRLGGQVMLFTGLAADSRQ